MKKNVLISMLVIVLMVVFVSPVSAERGDDTKRKSKNGKLEETIDGVKIVVEYGRPKVNGRAIWGKLVPFDKVWRTGANEANVITFDKNVTIDGKKLAAGSYSLFTIPGKTEWVVIFNSVTKQWGSMKYDKSKDALRVNVKPISMPDGNKIREELTFKKKGNKVGIIWEKLVVPFTVALDK